MGTPNFAVPTLKAIFNTGYPIKAVYSQPPRPMGRGYSMQFSPVHHFALEHDIPVMTPSSLKQEEAQEMFISLKADFAIVAAYGLILPKRILEAPKYGCVNVHASLLPRWRGAAPIQRAILAGDQKTGITIMLMEEGLDTGPIILQEQVNITSETTGKTLEQELAYLGAELILPSIEGLITKQLTPQPQPIEGATYASKLVKSEGALDWRKSASQLELQVRAFTEWPGSYFIWKEQPIKVLKACYEPLAFPAEEGMILDDNLLIGCGKDALRIIELQRPGKAPLKAKDFLNGVPLLRGVKLEMVNDSL